MTTGERIRTLRERAGMTRRELAGRCLVAEVTVMSWEMEKTLPRIDNAAAVADAFGVSLDYIAGREESQPDAPGATQTAEE